MSNNNVTLTIDGVEVTVPKGTMIVEAAKKIGKEIPVFCYHAKMEPVGMCRMCLVEVGTPVIDRATGQPELDESGQQLVKAAMTQLQLSARAYHRILKLSRTVADLAGEENIQSAHLAEALQYRPKGMMV